jgi:hypothetical protein
MKRLLLLACILLGSLSGYAQTTSLTPSQYVASLALLAPHRPVMERELNGVDVFHGGLIEYKHEDNHEALEDWLDDYPQEVEAYKISIQNYVNITTNTLLTGNEADIFADLKAQWVMMSHILDIEVYSN